MRKLKKNDPFKIVMVRISPDLHEKLRAYVVKKKTTAQNLIEEFIMELVGDL